MNQTATTIESKAAENRTWSTTDSQSHTGRVGVYAEAGAQGGKEAGQRAEKSKSAGVGVEGSYKGDINSKGSTSSTAVVSSVKAGGNINSTSKYQDQG